MPSKYNKISSWQLLLKSVPQINAGIAQPSVALKEPGWILSAVSWCSDTCAQTSYLQYPRHLIPVKSSVWSASLPTVSSLKRWTLLKNLRRWHLSCTELDKKIWLWEFLLMLILHIKVFMSLLVFPIIHGRSIVSQSHHHLKLPFPAQTMSQRPSSSIISGTYHPLHT